MIQHLGDVDRHVEHHAQIDAHADVCRVVRLVVCTVDVGYGFDAADCAAK